MAFEQSNEVSIFGTARLIGSKNERDGFLSEACGDDAALRARVEKLLADFAEESQFLEEPAPGLEETIVPNTSEEDRAASLDAGLALSFDGKAAVVIGDASHSVLRSLGNAASRVSLRESEAEGPAPITRPGSVEIPQHDSDGRYHLHGEIARGGMGAIIKGRDTDLGRDLAIKVLLDSHKDKPDVIQRFVEEAQIGGQLQHPGIAPVYELGQFSDQRPFFAMKLVKGQTLSRLLADRSDSADERGKFIGIFEQICQTMAYAHSRGVIHRDLKPANIMVGAFGEVQVMDWGLAKVISAGGVADEKQAHSQQQGQSIIQTLRSGAGSDTPDTFGSIGSETQMGSVLGTPAYMPPEQALGEIDQMDERADVFGLGAILCEILTGKPPYVAENGTRVFRMASRGRLDDCFQRLDGCGVDVDLIAIAKHCLELEPADRPRDAGVLAEKITGYLESVEARLRETEKQRATEAARADESRKRARVTMALAATVLLSLGVGGAGWRWMELQRIEHLAAVTSNVYDRLGDARLHRGLSDAVDASDVDGMKERIRELNVALESARDAAKLTDENDVTSALRKSSKVLLTTLQTELTSVQQAADQAAANRALEQELQMIRLSRAEAEQTTRDDETPASGENDGAQLTAMPVEEGEVERTSLAKRYRTAFRDAGLDLTANSHDEAAEWIRNSPIRETLIAALDDWSRVEISGDYGIPAELNSISWEPLEPKDCRSAAATLTPLPDGSILAGPATEDDDHYTIVVQPPEGSISALRLDMLTDESLPGSGPGRYDERGTHGNFHLLEVEAFLQSEGDSLTSLPCADAVASYSQRNRPVSRAIDGNPDTEWHVYERSGEEHQAIFLFESSVKVTTGETLVIELHQKYDRALGRFRLSCATDTSALRVWRKTSRNQLRALADVTDHSEWRKKLRSALAANDIEKLIAMVEDDETSHQSPAMLALLGAGLRNNSWGKPEVLETSVKILRDARNRLPSDFWLNYELGLSLAQPGFAIQNQERMVEGRGYLRTAVALRPRSLIALVALRSSLALDMRKAEDAAELLAVVQQMDDIAPHDGNVDRSLARVLYHLKHGEKREDAVEFCWKRIEANPDSAKAHFNLAYCLHNQGKSDEAVAAYQKAIELDPKDNISRYNIGIILYTQGNLNEAIATFCNVIELDPTYQSAHKGLGRALGRQGKLAEAKEECQHVIALYDGLITDETDNATLLTNRALAHMAVQQREPAQADWSRAIALDPNQLQRAFRAYSKAEQLPDQWEIGQQYIDAKPHTATRWREVASILVLAGEAERYAAFCDRAIGQFTDTAKAVVSARITTSTLLLPDAINLDKLPTQPFVDSLENGTVPESQQPWFWTIRALLAYRTGDAEAAIKYATRSEEHGPADVLSARTLSVIALAQHQQGNTDEATTALQEATQLLEKIQQNPAGGYRTDLQIAKILHREAKATINGKPSSTDEKADFPAETDNTPTEDPSEADPSETANQEDN